MTEIEDNQTGHKVAVPKGYLGQAFKQSADKPRYMFGYRMVEPGQDVSTLQEIGLDLKSSTIRRWQENRVATAHVDLSLKHCFEETNSSPECTTIQPYQEYMKTMRNGFSAKEFQEFVNNFIAYKHEDQQTPEDMSNPQVYGDSQTIMMEGEQWKTYLGTARTREGDCEDIAITKYDMARLSGLPQERLWVVNGYMRKDEETRTWSNKGAELFNKAREAMNLPPVNINGDVDIDGQTYFGHTMFVIQQGEDFHVFNNYEGEEAGLIATAEDYREHFIPVSAMNGHEIAAFAADNPDDIFHKLTASIPYMAMFVDTAPQVTQTSPLTEDLTQPPRTPRPQ